MSGRIWFPASLAASVVFLVGLTLQQQHKDESPCTPALTYEIAQPAVIMEVLDPSLEKYSVLWRNEISRRFPHAVGVLVHGGDFLEGEWIVGAPQNNHRIQKTVDVVKFYQAKYPDRTIVLLACNTGHLKLGIPGVFYSASSVWCVPDRALTPEMFQNGMARQKLDEDDVYESRWAMDPDVTGNIYEMVKE